MRKLPWTSLLLAIGAVAVINVAPGCGSEGDDVGVGPEGDGSADGASSGDGSTTTDGSSNNNDDGSSTGDGGGKDGSLLDGQVCLLVGQACGLASDCCTKICNKAGGAAVGECGIAGPGSDGGVGACLPANSTCKSSTECCTKSCVGGKCSATQCKADTPVAQACTTDAECCSGNCDNATRKCAPIAGGTCRTEGNPCGVNADCCSGQCDSTKHCNNSSFCTQNNDVCANDFECCGGNCNKAAGATLGRCTTVGNAPCAPAGTICSGTGCDNKCCSLSCGPLGKTGFKICQPPSGCKPQDELCDQSSDCCGGPGNPTGIQSNGRPNEAKQCVIAAGDTLGRCDSVQCLRPGDVCKAPVGACGGTSNNCCESRFPDGGSPDPDFCNSNPEACCSRDALGIPRCRAVNFVCRPGTTVPAGQLCATSADCCGQPCVDNKCLAACRPKGGTCTISADCCSGQPCVVPTGSTNGICGGILLPDGGVTTDPGGNTDAGTGGTCALYGQSCTQNSDCCSGVPCTPPGGGGRCRYP